MIPQEELFLMESFLADLINNPKIPKVIRYALVSVVSLFILYLGINCTLVSPMVIGKVFGVVLSVLILIAASYLFRRIYKS